MKKPPLSEIPKTDVWVTVVLTIATVGFYIPYWFWTRLPYLNQLKTKSRINPATIIILGILIISSLLFDFGLDLKMIEVSESTRMMSRVLSLSLNLIVLFQSFRVRRMLADHFLLERSFFWTFLFQIYYLQYVINGYDFDEDIRDSIEVFE